VSDPRERDIVDLVRQGETEVALTLFQPAGDDLAVVRLPSEEVYLALPPSSVASHAETGQMPLIVGRSTKHLVAEIMGAAGVSSEVVVEIDHREAIVPLVLAGVGAALVVGSISRHARALGAQLRRFDPPVRREAVLVHGTARGISPVVQAFLEVATTPEPRQGVGPTPVVA
jgi:DNA-binding transcriptional LysR family regulator